MSNSVARMHALVQQCDSMHCRVNYCSKHANLKQFKYKNTKQQ